MMKERVGLSHKPRWTFWLVMAGIVTTFGGSLPVGYNIGVVNAPAEIIKQFCNESMMARYDVKLSPNQLDLLWSTIVSVFLIGGMTGSLSGSWLADQVGRKGAYAVGTFLSFFAACFFYISRFINSFETLLIGRLAAGLAAGLTTCIVPMYLTELAPIKLRGAMGVLCPVGITVGVLLGQIMGLEELLGSQSTWHDLLSFYVLLVMIFALFIPFLPESPKYLSIIKRQPQMACKALSKIRGLPQSELCQEIHEMRMAEQDENEYNCTKSMMSVLKDKELMLPLLLVCFMQAGQQFSGINAVFYYSVSIFTTAGISEQKARLATIGAGGMNLLMSIVAIPLMSHCNRRFLFLLSCCTAAVWLIIIGLSIQFITSTTWMPYVSIVAILLYVLCYQLGLGPIPYFIGSELFEVGPRPSAMALGSMSNWGGNFFVGMLFPTMQNAMGPGSFVVFAIITILLFLFVRKYFPETRGKSPSEVAFLCRRGLASNPFESPSTTSTTSSSQSP